MGMHDVSGGMWLEIPRVYLFTYVLRVYHQLDMGRNLFGNLDIGFWPKTRTFFVRNNTAPEVWDVFW